MKFTAIKLDCQQEPFGDQFPYGLSCSAESMSLSDVCRELSVSYTHLTLPTTPYV